MNFYSWSCREQIEFEIGEVWVYMKFYPKYKVLTANVSYTNLNVNSGFPLQYRKKYIKEETCASPQH